MSYPLIIIGAGASHDYSTFSPKRPPITKELVDASHLDSTLIKKYPLVSHLLSEVESDVNIHNKGFEEALFAIKKRSGHISEIQSQLVALQFYLQELFETISVGCQNINNYKILQQRITTYSGGKACVVSFNYDSLFEDSIEGGHFEKMNDYVGGNLKLIKLHGSHDWVYVNHRDAMPLFSDNYTDGYDLATKNPKFLESFYSKGFQPYHKEEITGQGFFEFPALALPMPFKEDPVICPQLHINILQKEMALIDRVLIIGWRAADNYLLDLIKNHVNPDVQLMVVSKDKGSADDIVKVIKDTTNLSGFGVGGGFGAFIGDDRCHNFFSS